MEYISEGDFVMGSTSEGVIHGVVEHIMIEGGVYGVPGTEYAIQSMPPDNPAMAVRIYKQEDGKWEPTAYSIGMMYQDATKVEMETNTMDSETGMAMFDAQMGKSDDSMMPTSTYQGCDCETCKELNVDCPDCPVCSKEETDSEVAMAMYDSSIGKADPCWEGYVQRGMKPGADGNPVPNCIPVTKTESILFSAKDYSKQTRVTNLFKD
jgi:hypothetical protein